MADHQMFWLSQIFNDNIYLMNLQGEIVESAQLSESYELFGATYDGTYIYGVSDNDHITIIDPVNHVAVGEIYFSDVYLDDAISITYDSDNDAFWVGDQYGNLQLFDRSGVVRDAISSYQSGTFNTAGIAYDNVSEGGPYIWTFDWNYGYNSPQTLNQIDIATKTLTGVTHNVLEDFINGNGATDTASDLFLTTEMFPGQIVLGGILWGAPENYVFGYDIGDAGVLPGPGYAFNPAPQDNLMNVTVENTPTVSWENPAGTGYNKVYFSDSYTSVLTMDDAALVLDGTNSTTFTEYDHGTLLYDTQYFWRVVTADSEGMTPGYVWDFRTQLAPAPQNPTDVLAVWADSTNQVELSWNNAQFNIYNEPVEIDSTVIYRDEMRVGVVEGNGETFTSEAPQSGVYYYGIKSFANGFGSELAGAPALGVEVFVIEYSRNNLGLEIPDYNYNGVTDGIEVSDYTGEVQSVKVLIDTLIHSWVGDITLQLFAPDGTMICLSEGNGGSGDNYINTHFDDEATFPISLGSAPFTGEFMPAEPLSTFTGMPVEGVWKLKVIDDLNYEVGTLEAWTLTIIADEPMPVQEDIIWSASVNVKNAANAEQELVFGEAYSATDGIDMQLEENTLPPAPPSVIFDARFELPVTPLEFSWTDFRDTSGYVNTWNILFQAGESGYPIEISWDPAKLGGGVYTLKDAVTGDLINLDMQIDSMVTITNENINALVIERSETMTMQMPVAPGWQMVSVPLAMGEMTPDDIFGQLESSVYGFEGGYFETGSIEIGDGYWAKFPEQYSYTLTGETMNNDMVTVDAGWNLIGVHEYYAMINQISTEPAGIIASPIYGMDEGYYVAEMLEPCKGYWVRTSQAGVIHLSGNDSPAKTAVPTPVSADWTKIRFVDADGKSTVLYHGKESSQAYDLPPLPPAGVYDIRFNNDRIINDLTTITGIKFQGIQYPVTLSIEGVDLTITEGGKSSVLRSGESVEIKSGVLSIQTSEIPESFELSQNYPNPFNPSTKIAFSLPEAENVKVVIYDQLGQKVADLVNGNYEAGKHEIDFTASNLASGLYFYRIEAGSFTAVKKMMLLK